MTIARTDFQHLFNPQSIVVAGASANAVAQGNRFIRGLRDFGYKGAIYPLHPNASEIEGLKAYRSLSDVPEQIDYAYLTVPASQVLGVLARAEGRLRFAQIMASPDHNAGGAWAEALKDAAKDGNFRILGPNCMGTHSPRGGMTFIDGAIPEVGSVGIVCQSGGLGMDVLRRGQSLGLRFSGLVTLGNSIDVSPVDLLDFYLDDDATRVVGMYVEDIKDGQGFFKRLVRNAGRKPVVLLVGGITQQGSRAAQSHTGALAGNARAWEALARQTGVILTSTLDKFLDALQVCCWLNPRPLDTQPTIMFFGNGGGTSVLAADEAARAGFSLAAIGDDAHDTLVKLKLPPGSSLRNPIDMPASVLKEESGRIARRVLEIVRCMSFPHAIVAHLNLSVIYGYRHIPGFLPNLMDSLINADKRGEGGPHIVIVARSDGRPEVEAWKREVRAGANGAGVPVFSEIPEAVEALRSFCTYEMFLGRTIKSASAN